MAVEFLPDRDLIGRSRMLCFGSPTASSPAPSRATACGDRAYAQAGQPGLEPALDRRPPVIGERVPSGVAITALQQR
jgi:hypothetical protein